MAPQHSATGAVMKRRTLAAAVLSALLTITSVRSGLAHDTQTHEPAARSHPDAAETGAAFDVIAIERTLGDGPAETIRISRGAAVRLVLHDPAGTELHLHGYDLSGTASDGAPVVMRFKADHTGRFPIEAHGIEDLLGRADRALAYIEVRPE